MTLGGATLRADRDASMMNERFYGEQLDSRQIVLDGETGNALPDAATRLQEALADLASDDADTLADADRGRPDRSRATGALADYGAQAPNCSSFSLAAGGLSRVAGAIGVDDLHAGAETLQVQRRPHPEGSGAADDDVR